jgi:hypothetical protein
MECNRIRVRPGPRAGWLIEGGAREMGPYHCRDLALRVAIAEALSVRRSGKPAHVEVEDGDGVMVAKRCLCESFGR